MEHASLEMRYDDHKHEKESQPLIYSVWFWVMIIALVLIILFVK